MQYLPLINIKELREKVRTCAHYPFSNNIPIPASYKIANNELLRLIVDYNNTYNKRWCAVSQCCGKNQRPFTSNTDARH